MTTPTKLPDEPYTNRGMGEFLRIKCFGSATVDPASIASGAGLTGTIAVKGAALGDYVLASFSLDQAGLELSSYVNDGDSVTWDLQNVTGGAVDLASGTMRVVVLFRTQGVPPTI